MDDYCGKICEAAVHTHTFTAVTFMDIIYIIFIHSNLNDGLSAFKCFAYNKYNLTV